MDYEKKYKDLVEAVKELQEANPSDDGIQNWVKDNIPELKKSEDEKIREAIIEFFESQDDNTTYSFIPKKDILTWLEKQSEQKPIDNVEPKFNVGDWIVQENIGTYKVIEVCKSWYEVISNQNNHYSIGFDKEYMCHLWTIQDAKDGDVLCTYECIVIFKCIDGLNIKCYCTYHHFGFNPTFRINTLHNKAPFYPATKEQRDQLEKAMADAGYKWSVDKKELQKIKQESISRVKPKFNVGDTMRTLEEASNGITNGLPVVIFIDEKYYRCTNELIAIEDQDNYEYPPMNRRQYLISTDELAQAKKDAYNLALDRIEYHSSEPTFDDGWSAAIDYIKKNLQLLSSWKPSEMQMDALATAVSLLESSALKSLFQDLKKLKGV